MSENNTPVKNFSSAGAEKLHEMTENNNIYIDFLKFQGRVFKHSASVALEFFVQKPETKFIATKQQWEMTNYTVSQGNDAIKFLNANGDVIDFYDFSQVKENNPPYQWTINKNNVNEVKKQLGIPEKMSIISGVINSTVKPTHITSCMSALGIPPNHYREFSKSYINAIQIVIAGRLETGENSFNIQSDLTALKLIKNDSQKLAFLTHVANAARESLMKIEKTVQNINITERIEHNDLREMENTHTGRTEERTGRRTAGDTAGTAGEQTDGSKSYESGWTDGLGNNSESSEWKRNNVVSGVQNENSGQTGILVQVRPDMRTLQPESDGIRTVNEGRTDRNLWTEVDGLHGGELSASGGGNETVSQISDSGSFSEQKRNGIQGFAGQSVRTDDSTSDRLRGNPEMGKSEGILFGQHSDEGKSFSSGDRSLEEKLNTVFSSQKTEKTSTEKADVFILGDEMSEQEKLEHITSEIAEKEKKFTDLVNTPERHYDLISDTAKEIQELQKIQSALKEKIQEKPITIEDIQTLRDIRPVRKSVQNMLEHEVAQTSKLEKLLHSEMGNKSPYEQRKNNDDWRKDDSKSVQITKIQIKDLPKKINDVRQKDNIKKIERGTFKNFDTNMEIIFGKKSIDEIIAKAIQDDKRNIPVEARIATLYQMQKLVENAVCFDSQVSEYDSTTSKNKSPNTLFMHQMYGILNYKNESYLAKLSVEESYVTDKENNFSGTSNRIYNLRNIKITPIEANRIFSPTVNSKNATEDTSTSVFISIPQLYDIVKTYDKNYFENPEAVGRSEREAELYLQAGYNDAVSETEENNVHSEKSELIENIAESRKITKEKAEEVLQQSTEKLTVKRPVTLSERKKILDDFAKKNNLGKIQVLKKIGSPSSYYIAETENGEKLFNEQLCKLEKGEVLTAEKLRKSIDEFEKSDFFIQYQQKKSENKSTSSEIQSEDLSESERLKYDDDIFDTEVKLRKTVREAENISEKNDEQLSLFNEISNTDDKIPENEKPVPELELTEKKKTTNSEKLYNQFAEMFPDIVSGEHTYEHYGNTGDAYEPLAVEHLGGNTYSFMTYFVQNGDLMRDPDFTFELDHENKTLNILEYQQDGSAFGTVYQRVYDENNNPDLKLLSALEKNFMQNLKNAQNMERQLAAFTDKDGNKSEFYPEQHTIEQEEPEINDNTPELRTVLNEFSEKYGLGELNVEPERYSWKLTEKFHDGTEFTLGEIINPEYDKPFTSDELKSALEKFENQIQSRGQNITEIYNRNSIAENHGGISERPKVQENLPEIVYADKPSEKISNNISAIREMMRLEDAEKHGRELYDKRNNQYNSKQASEYRLRQYCGWGGLPQLFDERFNQYGYQRQQLENMLTPEEYSQARASTTNAHYTPQIIIDAMYKAIKNMDLPRDARILEPACGTGNFISRLPHSFDNAEITGVELDSITARIAKQINRNNKNVKIINSGFENSGLENNSFDLAIGNVPFGDYNMNDPDYVQDWKIHDAFFRKALDKVAAGGVVAFVTSTGTMDKANPKVREYLASQAELIGAVRLPNNAFSDAGTKVSSDIIFLKKRENPLQAHEPKPDWCYTIPDKNGLKINSYFVQNPQMMLGKMKKTTFQDRLTCEPFEGAELEKQLNEAIKNLNAKITVSKREKIINEQRGKIEPWGKNFTFQVKDDKIYYRKGSEMNEIKYTLAEKEMMKKLCGIRDKTRELIDLQKTSVSDDKLIPMREKLNQLYDEYRLKYGELSGKAVKKLFGNDSDYPILHSLEKYEKESEKVEKADIFFRRTVNPTVEIKSAENTEEALQISLDRKGKPDIPYMAMLLDRTSESVCSELLENGHIFIDPEKELPDKPFSGVVERSEYLCGNVRMKLTLAEEYAKSNPEYTRNINALKNVIPEDIKAEEISVQMGCTWIEPEDYTDFLKHLSGRTGYYNSRNCDVSYSAAAGEFEILHAGSKKDLNLNETTTYGTADYNMYQLAEKILNQRQIVVKREKVNPKDPSKTVTRTDPKATKIALEKAKAIREEFKKWIFADDNRKYRYERKYNDIFNSIVGREYDGSHLTFSGMKNDFMLRPHQKNCVARAIYGGNTLAAHVVGAGKSAVIFTSVMKKKELGLINKACVVVPKSLTEQTANEWRNVYPDAKILTVTNDDLSNETKRNLFTAKVATGSYDAVILSQEQFEKIPMSKQYRIEFMQKEIDSLNDMIREGNLANKGKKDYSVKKMETAKKRLQTKLEKLIDPKSAAKAKDDLLEFEQLGFDYLVCDEAHAYKNGFVQTKMTNVAGVTTKPSGRAEDMQMKTDYFNEQFGQGHILFATGTPIAAP